MDNETDNNIFRVKLDQLPDFYLFVKGCSAIDLEPRAIILRNRTLQGSEAGLFDTACRILLFAFGGFRRGSSCPSRIGQSTRDVKIEAITHNFNRNTNFQ